MCCPGLEPDQVFAWIRDSQPDANIVVVKQVTRASVDSAALNCPSAARTYDYLTKPFQVDQLREIVFRCLETKGLLRMTEARAAGKPLGEGDPRTPQARLGLTLSNMSDRTNVSLGYLSQIELGKNSASIETLYRICSGRLGMKMERAVPGCRCSRN